MSIHPSITAQAIQNRWWKLWLPFLTFSRIKKYKRKQISKYYWLLHVYLTVWYSTVCKYSPYDGCVLLQLTGGECSRLLPHRTPLKVLFLKKLDPITSPSAKCFHFWWGHFVYNVQHDELRSRDILSIMNEIEKQLFGWWPINIQYQYKDVYNKTNK